MTSKHVQHHRIKDDAKDKRLAALVALNHRSESAYGYRPKLSYQGRKQQSALRDALGITIILVVGVTLYILLATF